MSESAFISGTPVIRSSRHRNKTLTAGTRKNRCPTRAIADRPKGREEGSDEDALERSRAKFEEMFSRELKADASTKGQSECIWCEGTKVRRCSWCEGKGFRLESVHKSWEELSMDIEKLSEGQRAEAPKKVPVQCSACSGSKKLRCAYCRGSGIGSYGHAH